MSAEALKHEINPKIEEMLKTITLPADEPSSEAE
jgi:hypothetical protein